MKSAFEAAGDVRAVDLLAAFVSIWREKKSGSLRFSRGGSSAGYDLAEGEIVAVFSSEPRFETAAILVRAGKLDASALERLSMPPGADAALAALQTGILTRREWKWGEKIRTIEVLADLLTWPDGKYLFDSDARPEPGEFTLTIPRLLLELFLRSRDRNLIEHQLGSTDVPLRRSENFDEEFATFGLTADAESVVQLIDGGATAMEISERAPAEEFAVLKLLAALTTLGLLHPEIVSTEQEAPPRPPEPEAPEPRKPPPFESWAREEAQSPVEPEDGTSPAPLADVPFEEAAAAPFRAEPTSDWERSRAELPTEPPPPADLPPPAFPDWEEQTPLDRPLDVLEPDAIPPAAPKGRSRALIAVAVFVFLLAAVAGIVLLRSRSPRVAPEPPTPVAATAVPALPPPAPIVAPLASPVATAPAARLASPQPPRATSAPTARPAAVVTPAPRSEAIEASRSPWLERARRDRRRLQADKKTRYAIQLELVCEPPSLVEAWKHDQPAESLWLLSENHGGRECFRVLWGRYGSIEAARRAKSGIPGYFVTATNHPAVVGVR